MSVVGCHGERSPAGDWPLQWTREAVVSAWLVVLLLVTFACLGLSAWRLNRQPSRVDSQPMNTPAAAPDREA